MKILRLSFFSFLVSTIALLLSDQVLYRLWLLPQLKLLNQMPFLYNYELLLPIVGVIVFFGFTVSSWKQLFTVALMFALSHQILDFLSMRFEYSGYLKSFAMNDPWYFWSIRPFIMFCIYLTAMSAVRYGKVAMQKTYSRLASRPLLGINRTASSSSDIHGEAVKPGTKSNKTEDRMTTRITYHVVPDSSGWLVKKGRAKKASSAHTTKDEALHAASDLAKNHPLSQVVVHKASGIIASDRTYNYRHYKQKKRKKEVIKKIKKGLKRNKRKEDEQRLRRRKAAQLGIARAKRERYRRSLAAKKRARTRKRK
jgi:hypothetical protein